MVVPTEFRNVDASTIVFDYKQEQSEYHCTSYYFKTTTGGKLDYKLSEPLSNKYEITNLYKGKVVDPGMTLDFGADEGRPTLVQQDMDGMERIRERFIDIFHEKKWIEGDLTKEQLRRIIQFPVQSETKKKEGPDGVKTKVTYDPSAKFKFKYQTEKQGKESVKIETKMRTYENPLLVDYLNNPLPSTSPEDLFENIKKRASIMGVFRICGVVVKETEYENDDGESKTMYKGNFQMVPVMVKVMATDSTVTPTYSWGDDDFTSTQVDVAESATIKSQDPNQIAPSNQVSELKRPATEDQIESPDKKLKTISSESGSATGSGSEETGSESEAESAVSNVLEAAVSVA